MSELLDAPINVLARRVASGEVSPEELARYPLSGKLLSIRLDVSGRVEPEYQP